MYLKKRKTFMWVGLGDGATRHSTDPCRVLTHQNKSLKTYQLVRKMLMIILTKFKTSQKNNLNAHQL